MASSKSQTQAQIPPLVVPPIKTHKTTLIILHGRGSTASKFAQPLLTHPISAPPETTNRSSVSPSTFQDSFPHTKFIFPTALLRRAKAFNRSLIPQWFDSWSHAEPELKEDLQIVGLRETTIYLHGLLREEISVVGARNVVLMGLSQGCAASLIGTLLWQGESFGAVVGMCGYLPFRKRMLEASEIEEAEETHEDDDVFQREEDDTENDDSKLGRAVGWLTEELQVEARSKSSEPHPMHTIPVFMGHGKEDDKVPFENGKLAADLLGDLGIGVQWKEYEGLGHWYSEDMLHHVVQFIRGLDGWAEEELWNLEVVNIPSRTTLPRTLTVKPTPSNSNT